MKVRFPIEWRPFTKINRHSALGPPAWARNNTIKRWLMNKWRSRRRRENFTAKCDRFNEKLMLCAHNKSVAVDHLLIQNRYRDWLGIQMIMLSNWNAVQENITIRYCKSDRPLCCYSIISFSYSAVEYLICVLSISYDNKSGELHYHVISSCSPT